MKNKLTFKTYLDSIAKEGTKKSLDKIINELKKDKLNALSVVIDKPIIKTNPKSPLNNIPYVIKDNFVTKGIETTASSKILKGFIPNYTSQVEELLSSAGAINLGKTNMDELGLGGSGLYSCNGYVINPSNPELIAGGSSSGSAVLVASQKIPFAIGSDTGDSIRKPAAFNGIVGFKPSYGLVSRWGLIPYAPSLDHVGWFTNNVIDSARLLEVLAKFDERDYSSYDLKKPYKFVQENKKYKIALIKEVYDASNQEVKTKLDTIKTKLESNGHQVKMISFDKILLESLLALYMAISFPEAISCNSNLNGLYFGNKIEGKNWKETITKTRTNGFGSLVKKRFLIGSYILNHENYESIFLRSRKTRRLVINEVNRILKDFDGIIIPAHNGPAPTIQESLTNELDHKEIRDVANNSLLIANFSGIPSITIPCGKINGGHFGINIMSKLYEDNTCLNIAIKLEKLLESENE